jgi:hypothetical protein
MKQIEDTQNRRFSAVKRQIMKNHSGAIIFTALFGLLLLMGSCADFFNPPDNPGMAAGKVRVLISAGSLEAGARTALPASPVFDGYTLSFVCASQPSYTHDPVSF